MTDNKNAIVPILEDMPEQNNTDNTLVPLAAGVEWQQIVDDVIAQLTSAELSEDVIKATEYLICGWPLYKVAKRINRTPATIRNWLSRYPAMTVAIKKGHAMLHRWRLSRLEQQFLSAIDVSQYILDGNMGELGTRDVKLIAVQARQARYILGLFAGQKLSVAIKAPGEDKPNLNAAPDALDYVAAKMVELVKNSQQEPVELIYRVIDPKTGVMGPILTPDGEPYHGKLGTIDKNENGFLCHICGQRVPNLSLHVVRKHNMKRSEYEIVFMLEPGTLKKNATN